MGERKNPKIVSLNVKVYESLDILVYPFPQVIFPCRKATFLVSLLTVTYILHRKSSDIPGW